MTSSVLFRDLKRFVDEQRSATTAETFAVYKGLPFWIWNIEDHTHEDIIINGDCCFNHNFGLPKKDTTDKPFYDYEQIRFNSLDQNGNKHLWRYSDLSIM